jgi:hypothetical protein
MLPLMCEMWDKNEFSYSTKNKGCVNATGICVSLIAGCVPDYIRKLNRDATSAVYGGFTSRCIFVYATERSKSIAFPSINGQFGQLECDLLADLQHMNTLAGEFTFTKKAFDMWILEHKNIQLDPFESGVLSGFKSRMKSHIFKTAIALSVSESDKLEINSAHLFNAIKMVQSIRDKVDLTFRSLGESPLASQQDKVLRFIEKKGFCSEADIYSRMVHDMTHVQFQQIMYILQMAQKIRKKMIGKTEMFEPVP